MKVAPLIAMFFFTALTGCAGMTSRRTSVEEVLRRSLPASAREPASEVRFGPPLPRLRLLSPFGPRDGRRHTGVDLDASYGDTIYAAAPGVVVYAGDGISGYGDTVILLHANGYSSLYAHASELLVEEGRRVEPGDPIARVGTSGNASGPHLHFEIRKGLAPLDPRPLVRPPK